MPISSARSATADKRSYDIFCALAIALVGAALYAHTLHAPWYFDDVPTIVRNPLIRDLRDCLRHLFSQRGVALFSFALNYRTGGLSLAGYHLVNISIHLLTSWLVFLLLKRVVPGKFSLPLLGALVFAAHPLQTQAVTYVVQRMTSLSALFFFLSIYLFVRARESLAIGNGEPQHMAFYAGSLAAGMLALFTKENTAVLPFALFLFARFFLPGARSWRSLVKYIAPYLVVCGLAAIWLSADRVLLPLLRGESLTAAVDTKLLVSSRHNSPLNYLVTELSVLWVYIRMLLVPIGQALNHDYPIAATLLSPGSAAAFAGLAGLGGLAFYLRDRRPLLSCGIAWFFLTLAIESSFIPLDPLFEHRLYLPMFGFVLVLLDLSSLLPGPKGGVVLLSTALLAFATLTWSRNNLWNNPIALFEDNLKKAPNSERVMSDLAKYYIDQGRFQAAEDILTKALQINPASKNAYINLMMVYGKQDRPDDAYAVIRKGLEIFPESEYLHYGLGLVYFQRGEHDKAIHHNQKAVHFNPNFAPGYASLGRILIHLNRPMEAESHLRKSLALFAEDAAVHERLGLALYRQNRPHEALEEYRKSWQLDPKNIEAIYRTGLVALDLGQRSTAEGMLARLKSLDPSRASSLEAALTGAIR